LHDRAPNGGGPERPRGELRALQLRAALGCPVSQPAGAIVARVIETFCDRLQQLVDIDTPSGGVEQERVAELLAGWVAPLGCRTERVEEPDGPARSMVIALPGSGRGVVALLGHTDTVFPAGTVAARPFRRE